MKAIWQYFTVVLVIILHKVVLTFESVDEIIKYGHSNESHWAVLSCGAVDLNCDCVDEILKYVYSNESCWAVKSWTSRLVYNLHVFTWARPVTAISHLSLGAAARFPAIFRSGAVTRSLPLPSPRTTTSRTRWPHGPRAPNTIHWREKEVHHSTFSFLSSKITNIEHSYSMLNAKECKSARKYEEYVYKFLFVHDVIHFHPAIVSH